MKVHDKHETHTHQSSGDAQDAYRKAFDAAQPDPGRKVVTVDLEARELEWTIAPGQSVRAWGYNGQVPGPAIEGQVGDVLEVRFTNRLPEPTNIHWHGLRVPAAATCDRSWEPPCCAPPGALRR